MLRSLLYQDYLIELKDCGYSKETIISTHVTSKMLFSKALELDTVKLNPTTAAIISSFNKVGELCALKWKDISFDEKSISITKKSTKSDSLPIKKTTQAGWTKRSAYSTFAKTYPHVSTRGGWSRAN